MNIIKIVDDEGNVVSNYPSENCLINFVGDGNTVVINGNVKYNRIAMTLGNNVRVEIKKTIHVLESIYIGALRSTGGGVIIGENFSCVDAQFLLNEKALITIGNDCMVSSSVKLWGSDGHSIIDLNTNSVYNQSHGITIGNHVWICDSSRILKNSVISDNSIIGNSAVVCGEFRESNVIIAGNPAKIIKRNIDWNRFAPPPINKN